MDDSTDDTITGYDAGLDWLERDPWLGLKVQVRALLGALDDDSHVIIQLGEDENNTYQQARWLDHQLVVEAVSNEFLPEHAQLSDRQELVLLGLGWQPTTDGDELPNFHRCYESPVDLTTVAETMIATFAAVYGASPQDVYYVSPAWMAQLL